MIFDFIRFAIRYTFRVHIFICSAHSSYVNSLFLSLNNSNSSFEKFASCNMFCISIDVNRIGFITRLFLLLFLERCRNCFLSCCFLCCGRLCCCRLCRSRSYCSCFCLSYRNLCHCICPLYRLYSSHFQNSANLLLLM